MTIITVMAETERGALAASTLECVQEARELADATGGSVRVLLPGHGVAGLADELAAYGADAVTVIQHESLRQFSGDGWLAALEPVLKTLAPTLVLAPDTGYVRAWLPRLAARWRLPLVTGCVQVKSGATGQIEMTRPTYSGARHERLACPATATVLVTLIPGARGVGAPRSGHHAEVTRLTPDLNPTAFRDRTVERLPPDPHTVDIGEAERIVAGGLGVDGPEGMELVRKLADRLGAAVGGTRVVVDRSWLPFERQIGTTGKTVAPKLYLALGISGANQHTAGMTGSETVIVVNTDRTAPMFGLADLGVVGDLHQIVPELITKLGE
jgi:electron transfer flavoprotein alpha subunit